MPLWKPYDKKLSSRIADMNNVTTDGFAGLDHGGALPEALRREDRSWVHFDIFAWNPTDRPHGTAGGEAQGIRALERLIVLRYGR